MKKLNLITLIFALLTTCLYANAYEVFVCSTKTFGQADDMPTINRTTSIDGDIMTVTYSFDSLLVERNPLLPGTMVLKVPGFGINSGSGYAYPVKVERFPVENGYDWVLESVESSKLSISGNLQQALPVLLETSDLDISSLPLLKSTIKAQPDTIVSYNSPSVYRGNQINNIEIRPLQYINGTNTIIIHNRIELKFVRLGVDLDQSACNLNFNTDPYWFNASGEYQYMNVDTLSQPANRHYLILTTSAFRAQADSLASWKRECGFSCTVVAPKSWTEQSVKAQIKQFYDNTPDFYYLLLLGDQNIIPAITMSRFGRSYPTDFPYTCLDSSNDMTPDIYCGRIPANNTTDMWNAINKSIKYEKKPSGSKSTSSFAIASYFQDDNNDGVENRRFIETSERLYRGLVFRYGLSKRIYYAKPSVNPMKYFTGDSIPKILRRPNFAWDGSEAKIIQSFVSGVNLMIHRGHASYSCWGDPHFSDTIARTLPNSIYPVVLSINCQAGDYTQDNNLGKALLLNANGGCAVFMGASHFSYSDPNDAFILGIANSVWQTGPFQYNYIKDSINYTTNWKAARSSTIGEMMQNGFLCMEDVFSNIQNTCNYQKEIYHILGDPGLQLYWSSYNVRADVERIDTPSEVQVNLKGAYANIAFYNRTTGETARVYGNMATFPKASTDNVKVSIFRPGCSPVFLEESTVSANSESLPVLASANLLNESTVSITVEDTQFITETDNTCLRITGDGANAIYIPLTSGCETYVADIASLRRSSIGGIYFISLIRNNETINTIKIR